jgi:hypothetical protein
MEKPEYPKRPNDRSASPVGRLGQVPNIFLMADMTEVPCTNNVRNNTAYTICKIVNTVRIQYVYSTVANPRGFGSIPFQLSMFVLVCPSFGHCGSFGKKNLAAVLISNIGQDTRLTGLTTFGNQSSLQWREKILENTKASVHTL